MLNEIGVGKISFIYCKRSQKNFKPDIDRFMRILQSSSMQCGRTDIISLEIIDSLGEFVARYPECAVLDFCDTVNKEIFRYNCTLKNLPPYGFKNI